ncbi:ABC transporter ATP-binding protein [Bacillus sp. FJAT-49705]|uniref:ABC transporter ATP-binding protein n=1 Tax=Cytobacillus citreus TaxID=2833586 RepID=A0ABS5NZ44_9BACI|nr:ABC transporter ATP-binding protein [Cytobacillus citreus]MBS4193117.1 ABC transporter ATP-binding protein [Cytobacillus citreus]
MILSLKGIYKSFGKSTVLKNISLDIDIPKILALVGPNGSGKSTLLNIINNLVIPDQGEITILNKSNKDTSIFKEVSYMQDNSVLYHYLTGYDHLQFIANIQGLSKKDIVSTAERMGITGYLHKKVGHYSLGMKQHLLIAMAIVNDPKLLILDEPLNGLDPTSAIKIRKLLLELYNEEKAIIVSSHNLSEIDHITSHVVFLKDGHIIEEDIKQYEYYFYLFSVDKLERAKDILKRNDIAFDLMDGKIKLDHLFSLQDIAQKLGNEQVVILDIEKIRLGTENRYKKIFAKEVQS